MATKTVLVCFTIFCLLQFSSGEELTLQDAMSRAQEAISVMTTELQNTFAEMPQPETVMQQLQNHSHALAAKISDLVTQLQTQAHEHSGDLSGLLESVAQRWNETATSLQAQHPEAVERAEEIRTQWNNGLNTVVEEANRLAQAVGPHVEGVGDQLQQIARTALDSAIESANTLREHISSSN